VSKSLAEQLYEVGTALARLCHHEPPGCQHVELTVKDVNPLWEAQRLGICCAACDMLFDDIAELRDNYTIRRKDAPGERIEPCRSV
jgi:hypothetical protein